MIAVLRLPLLKANFTAATTWLLVEAADGTVYKVALSGFTIDTTALDPSA